LLASINQDELTTFEKIAKPMKQASVLEHKMAHYKETYEID